MKSEMTMVRVRFAPSPTGFLHIGSARTAIFNWLYARHTGGKFLLRVEDTDLKRSETRFLDEILEDLKWLGLDWDEEPIFQSRRFDVYREKAAELVAKGKAYKDGDAVLFKVEPGRTIAYEDLIHGRIAVETETIKDQVMIKSDGSPTYNFSCVVDDAHLGITHILRGDDHISNTPKQIIFYEAFGLEPPRFGHMPLILGTDGAKLSKRHGGVSVEEYKREGFLPEALANYLVLLGWMPKDGREVMPPAEAVRLFEISEMNDVQAKFDIQKLRWLNAEYIMKAENTRLLPLIKSQMEAAGFKTAAIADDYLARVLDLYKVRTKTLGEFPAMTDCFFREDFAYEDEGKKHLETPESREYLALLADRLAGTGDFTHDAIEAVFREFAEERGIKAGQVFHPARMAVSGKTKGAGLFEMMEVLGRERVVARMRRAANG
ncbi:MAG: glutamate--tRNA ligase [Acidobacteria bacterium]|nr:glutamate--tRNA ligase [Acidobacteriota bacterium]